MTRFSIALLLLAMQVIVAAPAATNKSTNLNKSSAADQKKLLILDFRNIDKSSSHEYLAPSFTETIRKNLKARYEFIEPQKASWEAVAKSNYIHSDNYHTRSVALQLGRLTKQDIVIAGGYRVRNKGGQQKFVSHVFIFNVTDRKLFQKVESEDVADSSIFTSIQRISDQIAVALQGVLPNRADYKAVSIDNLDMPGNVAMYILNVASTPVCGPPPSFNTTLTILNRNNGLGTNKAFSAFYVP